MKPTILCITPVKHLEGVFEKLSEFGKIIYIPDISKQELIEFLKTS